MRPLYYKLEPVYEAPARQPGQDTRLVLCAATTAPLGQTSEHSEALHPGVVTALHAGLFLRARQAEAQATKMGEARQLVEEIYRLLTSQENAKSAKEIREVATMMAEEAFRRMQVPAITD